MQNKVVIRFRDGKLLKGTTHDLLPQKSAFHVTDRDTGEVLTVDLSQLKAIFFVKTHEGKPGYEERENVERTGMGRKIRVRFRDGETLTGYTQGYSRGRPSFFVFPLDPESNNDRILVLSDATESVEFV